MFAEIRTEACFVASSDFWARRIIGQEGICGQRHKEKLLSTKHFMDW
jgi:hypothetical protein